MERVCCVQDSNISPKTSSCSMVLRSACSHKHSRESSIIKEHLHSLPSRKRNSLAESENAVCNGSLHLESSLKQLHLKSSENTYSVLKGRFYDSFEISKSLNVSETSSLNVSCAKEFCYSQLCASNGSSTYKNLSLKEYNSDYSSASESEINSSELLNPTSNMSRYTRNSVRSLSDSDSEDISIQEKNRRGYDRRKYPLFQANNLQSLQKNASYLERHQHTNNNLNIHTGNSHADNLLNMNESSHLDRTAVQYSWVDRFRWFLWRWTYMKIIQCVNFDVWILSRIYNFGRCKCIILFLMPLFMYLVWSMCSTLQSEHMYEALTYVPSVVFASISSVFSFIYSLLMHQEEEAIISDAPSATQETCFENSQLITSLYGLFTVISGWFSRNGNGALHSEYYSDESYHGEEIFGSLNRNPPSKDDVNSLQKEEIRILVAEILKEEFMQRVQETNAEKFEKDQTFQNEIKKLHLEIQSLSGSMERSQNIMKSNEDSNENMSLQLKEYKSHIDFLTTRLKAIEAEFNILKTSCGKEFSEKDVIALLEKHLVLAFKNVIVGDSEQKSKYHFFNEWLNSKVFSHEKLMQEINAAVKKQSLSSNADIDNVVQVVENVVSRHVDFIKKNISEFSTSGYLKFGQDLPLDEVKKIVKQALMLYDADKTGQVDYALESGGGSVLGTRCSETYAEKYGKVTIFGVPLWTESNSPRTAIQPDVQPGRCWAFKGSQGYLVLELSATIYPTGFTVEHIPQSLSPSGSIDSAPKNFSVWGLANEKDNKGDLLGEYWYDVNGDPLQYFAVQKPSPKAYLYIELQIHSNHGNMEFTCLYRFRVHGQRVR